MFTFIDLFSGIGGMRLAFEAVGGKCLFSSEWDKNAQLTYADNFGDVPHGDIRDIEASDIPDHDILVAGFPCQPFSLAGVSKKNSLGRKHGFLDETQGTLFFDVARILETKRPKAFLLENVRNLVSHDKGRTFKIILGTLQDDLGYKVFHKIIDASSVVPQQRKRIYIVGFAADTNYSFPELENKNPKLRDILDSNVDPKYTLSDKMIACLERHAQRHKEKGNGFGYGLANLDGVSRTLLARYYKDGSEILIPQAGRNPRRLTPKECARLMGFPDSYRLSVVDSRAYKQFGNSVVVPVVQSLAKSIVDALERPYSKPEPPEWPFND